MSYEREVKTAMGSLELLLLARWKSPKCCSRVVERKDTFKNLGVTDHLTALYYQIIGIVKDTGCLYLLKRSIENILCGSITYHKGFLDHTGLWAINANSILWSNYLDRITEAAASAGIPRIPSAPDPSPWMFWEYSEELPGQPGPGSTSLRLCEQNLNINDVSNIWGTKLMLLVK